MICPKCGIDNDEIAKFCRICGQNLIDSKPDNPIPLDANECQPDKIDDIPVNDDANNTDVLEINPIDINSINKKNNKKSTIMIMLTIVFVVLLIIIAVVCNLNNDKKPNSIFESDKNDASTEKQTSLSAGDAFDDYLENSTTNPSNVLYCPDSTVYCNRYNGYVSGLSEGQNYVQMIYGPDKNNFDIVRQIDNGNCVEIETNSVDGWTLCCYDGTEGWIRSDFIYDKPLQEDLPYELKQYANRLVAENKWYIVSLGRDDWNIKVRSSPEYFAGKVSNDNTIGLVRSGTRLYVEYICDGTWAVYKKDGRYVFSSLYDYNDSTKSQIIIPE